MLIIEMKGRGAMHNCNPVTKLMKRLSIFSVTFHDKKFFSKPASFKIKCKKEIEYHFIAQFWTKHDSFEAFKFYE